MWTKYTVKEHKCKGEYNQRLFVQKVGKFYPTVYRDLDCPNVEFEDVELSIDQFKAINDVDFQLYQSYLVVCKDLMRSVISIKPHFFNQMRYLDSSSRYILIYDIEDNAVERVKHLMEG